MTPLPDPTPIVDLIEAFRRSKAMFASVALGIFDRLEQGDATAGAVALELQLNPGAAERLLDTCVALGLVRKQDNRYSNQPLASAYLCRLSPQTLAGYILYSNNSLYLLWSNLEDAVREGTHRWQQTFGIEGMLFDHFYKSEESKRDFLSGMHGYGMISSPRVVSAFDLSRFRRLVDLGGATGHLAVAACEKYSLMRAAVFDLPPVVEVARQFVDASGCPDRVELIGGDFFHDPLPQADLYALGRILHDWSADRIRWLLGRLYHHLPKGGGLLIAERLLDDDQPGPLSALLQSLNMLVCTEGQERTLAEYTSLLHEAGFSSVEGRRTGAPLDALLAIKS